MIKLVASDLDGTLLQGDAQAPSQHALDLIMQLKEKGIRFVAASGRQYDNLRRIFGPIKDEISYIAENGSLCVDQGEVLSRGIIDRELGLRILEEIKKNDDFEIVLSCERTCYMQSKNEDFIHHICDVLQNTTEVVDDVSAVTEPFLKIAICSMTDGPHVMDKYLKHLQDMFGAQIKVVTSGNIWIDFIAPNANKGTALETLLKKYDIKPEECVAFGDQYNDVEMLQLVGTSYAMSNAAPGISYYSTYVTSSVEEVLEDLAAEI